MVQKDAKQRGAATGAQSQTGVGPAVIEELFRLFVESVQDYAISLLDPQGHIISWNAGSERLTGYRADEVLGKPISIFYTHEEVAQGKPEQDLQVATAQGRFEAEGWRVRKDGSRYWITLTVTALRDTEGRLIGFARIVRDLTERQREEEALRASEKRFRLLAENAQDVILRYRLRPSRGMDYISTSSITAPTTEAKSRTR